MDWDEFDYLVDAALAEDEAGHDVTTLALIARRRHAAAELICRKPGVVCGLPLAARMLQRFKDSVEFRQHAREGDPVEGGCVLASMRGSAHAILAAERTMLNFLQRLSGIATLTARFVAKVQGTGARIYDTRKTTPGWRRLEKYAVRCGGGINHRLDLGEMVLIKDNHLALTAPQGDRSAAIREAVLLVREEWPGLAVEVEVDDLSQLESALVAAPDIIMLDNLTPAQVRQAVELVKERSSPTRAPQLEASGGIALDNVAEYAAAGVDRIAVGCLTHSAPALDISLTVSE